MSSLFKVISTHDYDKLITGISLHLKYRSNRIDIKSGNIIGYYVSNPELLSRKKFHPLAFFNDKNEYKGETNQIYQLDHIFFDDGYFLVGVDINYKLINNDTQIEEIRSFITRDYINKENIYKVSSISNIEVTTIPEYINEPLSIKCDVGSYISFLSETYNSHGAADESRIFNYKCSKLTKRSNMDNFVKISLIIMAMIFSFYFGFSVCNITNSYKYIPNN
jgi:hypothetical protein